MLLITSFDVYRAETNSGNTRFFISDAPLPEVASSLRQDNWVTKVSPASSDDMAEFVKQGELNTDDIESFEVEEKTAKVEMINSYK